MFPFLVRSLHRLTALGSSEYPYHHPQAETLRQVANNTYQEPDPSTYDRARPSKRSKSASRPNTASGQNTTTEPGLRQTTLNFAPRNTAVNDPPVASTSRRTYGGRIDAEITKLLDAPTPPSPALAPTRDRASSGISRLPRPTVVVPSPSTHWTHREETPTPLVAETVYNPQPPYTFETRLDPRYQIYQTGRPHTADLNIPRRPVPPPLDHGEDIFDPAVYRTLGDGGPPTKTELSEIERIREGRCWTGGRYRTDYWILKEYRKLRAQGLQWDTPTEGWRSSPYSVSPVQTPFSPRSSDWPDHISPDRVRISSDAPSGTSSHTPSAQEGLAPPPPQIQITPSFDVGSPPRLDLPRPMMSPRITNLSPSAQSSLSAPAHHASPRPRHEMSPDVRPSEGPLRSFDSATGSPLLSADRTARVLDDLRVMTETHNRFVEATALPTPAYAAARSQAAADLDFMRLRITDSLIPATTRGPLPPLRQRNIYPDDVPYAPHSRLPVLNRLARAELDLAMAEVHDNAQRARQWGQPPPRD